MSYVPLELTKEEGRILWQLNAIEPCRLGYVAPSDNRHLYENWWFKILETDDTPEKDVKRVAVEPTLINNVLTAWHRSLVKNAVKKGLTKGEKLSAYLSESEVSLFNKLSATKTNQNTMIDLKNITPEALAELEKQIADYKAKAKKVTEAAHLIEATAKKAGYETLDAALSDMGYVKATAKPARKVKTASGGARKPRVKVTDEIRAKVIASIQAGGKTYEEIAEENGLSTGTVAAIKKAAGLTK